MRIVLGRTLRIATTMVVLVGCTTGAERPPVSASTVTSAELTSASNEDAIARIATARCEKAVACNAIGPGRGYEDQAACLETTGLELDREIGSEECPSGVSRVAAVRCVLDIRAARCGEDVKNVSTDPSAEEEKGASPSTLSQKLASCERPRLCAAKSSF